MEQFKIEVAYNGQGKFYNIKPLGNSRYQINIEEETIGTIQLDENNHALRSPWLRTGYAIT